MPPENAIQAKRTRQIESWRMHFPATVAKADGRQGARGGTTPDLRWLRVLRPRTANADEPLGALKPRGDSDDADRRLAESQSPFLPMDARFDVAPAHYFAAKDERVIRDSTRSSS